MADPEALAAASLEWVLGAARDVGDGALAWPAAVGDDEVTPMLYSGTAGVVLTLLEAHRHFGDDRFATAAVRGGRSLAAAVETWDHDSLYFGLTGLAVALHALDEELGDTAAGGAADRALGRVRSRFDGERWNNEFELLGGNAGIGLGALRVGDLELAALAVAPYERTAEPTTHGVHWEVRRGTDARLHHYSHGTLGIVAALAKVGRATQQPTLVALALAGADDVVARNEDGADGFLVPHSDPQFLPERVPRISYGWCHGPAGDARAFRALYDATAERSWLELVDRCWQTVTSCGLPARLRPGFWDNNARCCGTAGVLALASDVAVLRGEALPFADVLVEDLAAHATLDAAGARWSNVEHRATPPELVPHVGWAQGSAGIARELLRHTRLTRGGGGSYAVPFPDEPPAVASPSELT